MFIIIVFLLGIVRPSGLHSFVPALLLSTLTSPFSSSSVSLFYFILAVPMSECLGKHSCMSSPFPQRVLNGTVMELVFHLYFIFYFHIHFMSKSFMSVSCIGMGKDGGISFSSATAWVDDGG